MLPYIYIYHTLYTIHYMDPISYRNTIYRICRTPQVSAVKTRSSCRKGMERDLVHLSGRKKMRRCSDAEGNMVRPCNVRL